MFKKRTGKALGLFIVLCMVATCLFLTTYVSAGTQATYYVSPSGSDTTGDGSIGSPWQTIGKARDVVRTINGSMTGDIIVYLRGGTYTLTGTVNFTQDDSGTNGYYVCYKNYPGETPVISGGKTVTGWSVYSGSIYKANVGSSDDFRQIYVNGVRGIRARSTGPLPGAVLTSTGYTTTDTNMQYWGNKNRIEFVYWGLPFSWTCLPVSDISGTTVTMMSASWEFAKTMYEDYYVSPSKMQYMENAYELLDSPGEWYLDVTADMLYYIPRAGENMSTAVVEAPVVEKLIEIKGILGSPVNHIQFEGIKFILSNYTRPSFYGNLSYQANQYYDGSTDYNVPAAAIRTEHTSNINFERCKFTKLGSAAINMFFGSQNNRVRGCTFIDLAGSGIHLGEASYGGYSPNSYRWNPTDSRLVVKNNIIDNCYFERCAADYKEGMAIFAGWTEGTVISHNEICDLPYSGISVGWGFMNPVFQPNCMKNLSIKYNYIHDVLLNLYDGAGIYTSGDVWGGNAEIAYNFIKNQMGAYGSLYFDATTNWNVHDNVIDYNPWGWLLTAPECLDMTVNNTYTNQSYYSNRAGSKCVITNTTVYSGQSYPSGAQTIINSAGLESAYQDIKGGPTPTPTPGGPTPTPAATNSPIPTTTPGANLVTNPSFEADGGSTQSPTGWSTSGTDTDADYVEPGNPSAHSGTYVLVHWKHAAYQVYTYQTKTGLTNGLYTLKAWVKSGGGLSTAYMEAKDYGGSSLTYNIPTSSSWTQISITNINVTNGQCTIGFYSNSPIDAWYVVDDVEFYNQLSTPTPTPTPTPGGNLALGITPATSVIFTYPSRMTDGTKNDTNLYSDSTPGTGLQWVKLDLGASYNLSEVKVWHFWGDARSYHDVIGQVSNTSDFSSGVTTVFNNDTNNSAGQGTGSDSEYTETSSGKDITFGSVNARYVRLWTNGNTVNNYNHYVEIEVYAGNATPTPTPIATPTPTPTPTSTPTLTPTPTPASTATPMPGGYLVKVNCGGSAVDGLSADQAYTSGSWGYVGGDTYSTQDTVSPNFGYPSGMKTERYGNTQNFSYKFTVSNGNYTVKLYMAELYHNAAGLREFNVDIEGERRLSDYDVYADAGGHDKGVEKIFTGIAVSDGILQIDFNRVLGDGVIMAIVVSSEGGNLALGITPTTSVTFTYPSRMTDGTKNDTNLYSDSTPSTGLQWVKLDLGASYNLSEVKVWHFWGDARSYHDVIGQVSNTSDFSSGVTTVFNNDTNNSAGQGTGSDSEYTETSSGKDITFGSVNARYVRLWTNGNTVNNYNHYVEIEVYGGGATPTPTPTPAATPTPTPTSAPGNLVTNPGFEADGSTQSPTGWSTSGTNADADYVEPGYPSHSGTYILVHWKASAYQVYTYQTKTGLTNGLYTLKAWVKSEGGLNTAYMEAKDYGGSSLTYNIPTSGSWTQISITNINVTNGQCTIGFYSDSPSEKWYAVDDVEFYNQSGGSTPTPTSAATATPTPTPQTITIGNTSILDTSDSGNSTTLVSYAVTLSQTATIQSLSFYVAATGGNLRLGIYDNVSGHPDTLKAWTNEFTPTSTGWNTQNVTSPVQLTAGTYWLAFSPSSDSLTDKLSSTGGSCYYKTSYTYGALPSTFPTGSTNNCQFSYYATLTY